jgi:capsular exopolysaccharide synthesis family protein
VSRHADGSSPSQASQERIGGAWQIREYGHILARRRWVVFSCLAIVVATTMILTLFATPEYEAKTTIQIERQGPDILNFKDVVGTDPSSLAYQDFYQTQYRILQSRTVLRLAAERLDLMNWPEFASRKGTPIERLYRWTKSSLFGRDDEGDPLAPAIRFLEDGLSVRPVRNSQLVEISFVDRDRMLAQETTNAIAAAYLEFSFQSRYDTTAVARDFLTKEVARVEAETAELERKLQEYGSRKEILSVQEGAQDISSQALAGLNARYVEAKGRMALARARHEAVRELPPDSLPEVLNSPLINSLKEEYAEIERRHSLMSERFKPEWPALVELEGEMEQARERLELEIASIVGQVRGNATADYERARAEVQNLDAEVARQKVEVQRVNRDTIEYASIKAQVDTKRKVLTDLASRRSETETSERLKDTRASNIRIVDPAELPKKPVRPKKLLNLALSLLLGSGLGVGLALFLEYLDNTVKNEQDIERVAGLAVLGYIPHFQPLRVVAGAEDAEARTPTPDVDLSSHHDPRSPFAEAFKNLRTSLLLASPEHPPRTIVVTSCEPQDGKSTVSLNLAIVLTQLGRRVLVVDADLRRPRLHRVLSVGNTAGLSSLLSGNAALEDVLQETMVPNLSFVSSGPIPPNPSELLGSPAWAAFLHRLGHEVAFDHVIVDSPPLASVTDPMILASCVDATVIVVRAGKTARESLAHSTERLRQSRAKVIGAVLNAVTESAEHYYYGRYRYDRTYGEEETVGQRPSTASRLSRRRRRRAGRS